MRKIGRAFGLLALTLTMTGAAFVAAALAEYEVMRSTAPGYTAGQKIPAGAKINVPDGKSVRLLDKTGGGTHDIAGPYDGTVADYAATGCSWLKRITGGCKPVDGAAAAVRGLKSKSE